jgi:hypothetical protein
MAPAKARKLKVYQAPFGFHESVVAAPSQTAALRAWGSHQNLFAEGLAKVTTESAAVEAALKHPETPLRRAIRLNLRQQTYPRFPLPRKRGWARKAAPQSASQNLPHHQPIGQRLTQPSEN